MIFLCNGLKFGSKKYIKMATTVEETEGIVTAVTKQGMTNHDVVDYYAKWSNTYDHDLSLISYNPPELGATELAAFYPGQYDIRILDCAAGTGLVAEHLHRLGYKNTDALDACQGMLDKAAKKNIYKNLICDFLGPNRLNIDDNMYDAIVGVGCFCEGHVKADCLAEMARVVRPGGKIVLAMREEFLHTVADLRDNLEATMQRHHDNGLWKWIARKVVPKYYEDLPGLVYIFDVL